MSRRRARCSSSSTSSSSARLSWKNAWWVCQSPSTSACRMNSSRDSARVDPPVVHLAGRDDRQPVQGDLLVGDHRALLGFPVRLAVGALDQVLGQRLDPLGLDPRGDPAPQPGRLDQFGGHHPARRLLEQRRAGEHREAGAAGAEVVARSPGRASRGARAGRPAASCAGSPAGGGSGLSASARSSDRHTWRSWRRTGPATPGPAGSSGTPPCTSCGTGWRTALSAAPAGSARG